MEQITTWQYVFMDSFRSLGNDLMTTIPDIMGAILLLLIGWIIAKILSILCEKLLVLVKFNKLADKVGVHDSLEKANIKLSATRIVRKFVYWFIYLYVIVTACDALGWTALSTEIGNIIHYLPKLLIAIIILIVGGFIANIVRQVINTAGETLNIGPGRILASFVFYLLMTMVILTSLNQAGVDISLITSNFTVIIAGLMLAFAISYGFASRDILQNILSGLYSRNRYNIGDNITVDSISGEIVDMDSFTVTIRSGQQEISIPASELTCKKVFKKIS